MADIIFKVFSLVMEWIPKFRSAFYTDTLRLQTSVSRSITHTLNQYLLDRGGSRILLLRCNNGSGIPKYGRPHYSTLVDHCFLKPCTETCSKWDSVLMDEEERQRIVELRSAGSMIVDCDELGGVLKMVYQDNDVCQAVLLNVLELQKEYWFVCIHVCKDDQDKDRTIRQLIDGRLYLESVLSGLLRKVTR